jgi:cellulose synthase/poly-beta-1,6-N-acetylglucosamine synthase-like glycosyltransferase
MRCRLWRRKEVAVQNDANVNAMTDRPTVAVCIPTYNQSRYLIESVRSACAQTYPGVEVWVSDDASTDDTPAVLERLAREFPQLRYHRQAVNLNIAANNTWLLSQPQTEYTIRLDSDDIMEPHYVETLVALLAANPRAGYAHSAVRVIDENGAALSVTRVARPTGFRSSEDALRDAVAGYRVAANIVMFRTAALRELDYYRGRPDFVEDYDLAVRMPDAGYGNVYCDEVLSRYRVWTDPKRVRSKRKGLQLRGYIRIFDEALGPAFRRRGWSEAPLRRQREKLAVRHAAGCFGSEYTPSERAELRALLRALAGEPAVWLRLRLRAIDLGFGSFFDANRALRKWLKQIVKETLSRYRTRRSAS